MGSLGAAPAGAATGPGGAVITCLVKFNNPHGSTHVRGTINASVTTTCTAPVDVITPFFRLNDLTRGRTAYAANTKVYNTSRSYANAALSCAPGTYQGTGSVQIRFPAGFTPRYQYPEGASQALGIACGVAYSAPTAAAQEISLAPGTQILADGSVVLTLTAERE